MTAGYLEDCGDLTASEIAAGFSRYRVAGSPFPPSGPELRKHGLDVRADRLAQERASTQRLPSPPRGADAYPPDHRAEMQRRFAELLAELKSASEADDRFPRKLTPYEEAKAAREAIAKHEAGERKPQPVKMSDALLAQIRGELPIGQGKLGAVPVGEPIEYREAV